MISPILYSSSSSASFSSFDNSTRIRFAPLPDPRRDVVSRKFVSSHVGEYSPCLDTESLTSTNSSITTDSPLPSPTTPKPLKSWKQKSFFKPLLKRPASASAPTSPLSSSDSISLSRRSESDNDASSRWGLPLRSVKSATPPPKPSKPPPIARAQSGSFTKHGRSGTGSVSGLSLPLSTNHVRKGTKMLNGRVYGARHNNENPFANARDEADPAFVEWGHGGMGSVKNGVGGDMWKRLQSENQGVMVGSVEGGTWGKSADDGDDGSGMGWVKRRREQRELQKKELEDKNRESPQHHSTTDVTIDSTPP